MMNIKNAVRVVGVALPVLLFSLTAFGADSPAAAPGAANGNAVTQAQADEASANSTGAKKDAPSTSSKDAKAAKKKAKKDAKAAADAKAKSDAKTATDSKTASPPQPTAPPAKAAPAAASATPAANPNAPKSSDPQTGVTASGQPIYTGPKGGKYHLSASGKKVYEKKDAADKDSAPATAAPVKTQN